MSKGDILHAMDYLGHIVEAIELVWKTIHGDLPELRSRVAALMAA
jgi:uncharacterized protein with HEPN domain